MSLRDEIGDVLLNFRLLGLTIKDGEDAILALIDGQRCTWTKHQDSSYLYKSTCPEWDGAYRHISAFCPCCGKKIKVKE